MSDKAIPTAGVDARGLLPCPNPWCTSRSKPVAVRSRMASNGWHVACACGVRSWAKPSEIEAIAFWNTRTTPPASDAAVSAGEGYCADCTCDACRRAQQRVSMAGALAKDANSSCWSCSCGWVGCYTQSDIAEYGEPSECNLCCQKRLVECDPPSAAAAPKAASEDDCTCQRHPTHCANDCPTHGLDGESYTAGEPNHAKAASEDGATGLLREAAQAAHRALYNLQLAVVQSSPPDVMRAMLAGAKEAEFGICAALAASPTDATGARVMRERCAAFLEARGDELLATSANKSTGNMMREIFRGEAQSIRNLPVAGETL